MILRLIEYIRAAIAVLLLPFCLVTAACPALAEQQGSPSLTVYAAASLKDALDLAAVQFTQSAGVTVTVSYASSPALAKQIEQGAPADIFISADLDWMDYLLQKGLLRLETRTELFGNRLVLIAPIDSELTLAIASGFDLAGALGAGRLAMADVKAVPAGKYAKAALEKLGVWPAVASKIAESENVRAALAFVARGEAPLGIVYQSDAAAEAKVKIVATFAEDLHPPIIYPAAVTSGAKNRDHAAAFISYLQSPAAQAIFLKAGFTLLKK